MDIIIYNIGLIIASLIFGYLLGSVPNSIIIGKVFFHKDLREYGSKNAGGTNAGRVFGKKVGFIVIVLDMIKTIAPVWIMWAIVSFSGISNVFNIWNPSIVYYAAGFACVIGHCYPIFAQFRGGKAVASYFGICAGTLWPIIPLGGLLYLAILKWKKYVSLASIVTSLVTTLIVWIFIICNMYSEGGNAVASICVWGFGSGVSLGWEFGVMIILNNIILILRHKQNIERLLSGTERKITWMK
jgi:acyl phosphate:glycerol-3-phosphate acyltransferase